jgi:uncharacterized membrane protein
MSRARVRRSMRARIGNVAENIRASLWFIPTLCVLAAVALSAGLVIIDSDVAPDLKERWPWLFGGTAEAARTMLAAVATSVITVVAVAFSVTLVAVQQAASRYTPRVLQTFIRDRGNQIVLGVYIGTFTYALLVLRQIRESTSDQAEFVPPLSITAAMGLTLVSLGCLVYFIDHTIRSLEVTWILGSIRRAVQGQLERLYPSALEPARSEAGSMAAPPAPAGQETAITSLESGYLRRVDEHELVDTTRGRARFVRIYPTIGDYLLRGAVLARIWSDGPLDEARIAPLRNAFVLDRERSIEQDPLFGVVQIVDIAVKALSPGVNDPTTATQCLAVLGDVVADIIDREFPPPLRTDAGTPQYFFSRPSFADFVDAAFSQIRRAAVNDVHVTRYLLRLLGELARRAPTEARRRPIHAQVAEVLIALPGSRFTETDRDALRRDAESVLRPAPDARRTAA